MGCSGINRQLLRFSQHFSKSALVAPLPQNTNTMSSRAASACAAPASTSMPCFAPMLPAVQHDLRVLGNIEFIAKLVRAIERIDRADIHPVRQAEHIAKATTPFDIARSIILSEIVETTSKRRSSARSTKRAKRARSLALEQAEIERGIYFEILNMQP